MTEVRYTPADPPVVVDIVGPRGTFRGLAVGWSSNGRVHVRWYEGPGEQYVQTVASSNVRRVVGP